MKKKFILSSIFIGLFAVSLLFSKNTLDNKEVDDANKKNIALYYQENKNVDGYVGILSIPKIKLQRGFFAKESPLNTLSKNIYYLKESIPLEEENSMIILAAHRGSSKVAFFNELEHLIIGDEIFLNYQDKQYTYILTEIYDEPKDGYLNIYRDETRDSLILITCNKYLHKYQTIYVSYRKED